MGSDNWSIEGNERERGIGEVSGPSEVVMIRRRMRRRGGMEEREESTFEKGSRFEWLLTPSEYTLYPTGREKREEREKRNLSLSSIYSKTH